MLNRLINAFHGKAYMPEFPVFNSHFFLLYIIFYQPTREPSLHTQGESGQTTYREVLLLRRMDIMEDINRVALYIIVHRSMLRYFHPASASTATMHPSSIL